MTTVISEADRRYLVGLVRRDLRKLHSEARRLRARYGKSDDGRATRRINDVGELMKRLGGDPESALRRHDVPPEDRTGSLR